MKATFFEEQDFEDFDEVEEIESEDELQISEDDDDLIYTDVDQLSFENVNMDYFSLGYVDPSDFEF